VLRAEFDRVRLPEVPDAPTHESLLAARTATGTDAKVGAE
jgi:hypothetical protein